jgi:lipopolysaccharide export system permease protein
VGRRVSGDAGMRSTIARYLNRGLLKKFGIVLFAVLGFATVFDLLDVIDDVVEDSDVAVVAVLTYLGLRLPSLLSQVMPLIALLGALYFITDVMRSNELVIIWAMGRSTRQVILKLMPMLLLLAGFKFVLDDQLVPASVEQLREWKVGAFKRVELVGNSPDEIWLRSGSDIIRVPADSAAGGEIRDLSIFTRDEAGKLVQRVEAMLAEPGEADDQWRLTGATLHGAGPLQADGSGNLLWQGQINVDHVRALARPARELTLSQQIHIIENDGFAIRTTDAYVTWANHRVAGSMIPSLLVALVLALGRSFSRSGNALGIFVPAMALGFGFLIMNGVVLALGEVSIIRPLIAAWLPTIGLFGVITVLLLRTNRLVAMRLIPKPSEP